MSSILLAAKASLRRGCKLLAHLPKKNTSPTTSETEQQSHSSGSVPQFDAPDTPLAADQEPGQRHASGPAETVAPGSGIQPWEASLHMDTDNEGPLTYSKSVPALQHTLMPPRNSAPEAASTQHSTTVSRSDTTTTSCCSANTSAPMTHGSANNVVVAATEGEDQAKATTPWSVLAHTSAPATVLRPGQVGPEVRLVSSQFRTTFDAGVRRITARPPLARAIPAHVARLQRAIPGDDDGVAPPRFLHLHTAALDCSQLCLGPKGAAGVAAMLGSVPPLAAPLELELSGNVVGPKGMASIATMLLTKRGSALTRVQALHLASNELYSEGVALLAAALAGAAWVSGLRVLDLSDNGIGNSGVAKLASALAASQHLASLERLSLAGNRVTAAGCVALCSALQAATHLSRLRALDLSGNDIAASEAGDLPKALVSALRAAHIAGSLQELRLAACGLRDAGVVELAELLTAAGGFCDLRILDLSVNAVGVVGANSLARAVHAAAHLGASLEELHLGSRRQKPAAAAGIGGGCPCSTGSFSLAEEHHHSAPATPMQVAVMPALLASSQLHQLRSMDLNDCGCMPGSNCDGGSGPRLASALPAAHHLSGLTSLRISAGCGVDCWPDALTRATHLTGLRSLELAVASASCHGDEVFGLTGMLVTATHLAGLTRLDLAGTRLGEEALARVCSALAAATHLSNLRSLCLDNHCASSLKYTAALLQSAPHLAASLEDLNLKHYGGPGTRGELAAALAALAARLPALQGLSLELAAAAASEDGAVELAAALAAAVPHLRGLRTLTLRGCDRGRRLAAVSHALRGWGPHLSHLESLAILPDVASVAASAATAGAGGSSYGYSRSGSVSSSSPSAYTARHHSFATHGGGASWCGGFGALIDALKASPHLAGLQLLVLDGATLGIGAGGGDGCGPSAEAARNRVHLAAALRPAKHLAGLHVVLLCGGGRGASGRGGGSSVVLIDPYEPAQ